MTGILMFPAMLVGPCLVGIVLTRIVDGRDGVQDLFCRILCWRVCAYWYGALLIPPILVLTLLFCLKTFISPVYASYRFFIGILFAVPAGVLEEIGWTGYAFPKMQSDTGMLAPSILLGFLWAIWHVPVIDYLGAATPHGAYWLPFFSLVRTRDGGSASADLLDLREHKKNTA